MTPAPETIPPPGILVRSMPKSRDRCSTRRSSSKNEPGSRRRSTRSRAVSFPSACCRATRSGPPPCRLLSRRASRSAIRFSIVMRPLAGKRKTRNGRLFGTSVRFPFSVFRFPSKNDSPLFGELPADSPEELLAVDLPRGDLVAGSFHHPPRLFVESAFLFRFRREGREDGLAEGAGRLLLEQLSRCETARRPNRDELFLPIGQAHPPLQRRDVTAGKTSRIIARRGALGMG